MDKDIMPDEVVEEAEHVHDDDCGHVMDPDPDNPHDPEALEDAAEKMHAE